jgi:hypothetical protein
MFVVDGPWSVAGDCTVIERQRVQVGSSAVALARPVISAHSSPSNAGLWSLPVTRARPGASRGAGRGANSGCMVRSMEPDEVRTVTVVAGSGRGNRLSFSWQSKGQGFESPQLHRSDLRRRSGVACRQMLVVRMCIYLSHHDLACRVRFPPSEVMEGAVGPVTAAVYRHLRDNAGRGERLHRRASAPPRGPSGRPAPAHRSRPGKCSRSLIVAR